MDVERPALQVFEPFEFTVDEELQSKYLSAEDDFNPRYLRGTGGKPPIVHPGLLLVYSNFTKSPSYGGPNKGTVHAKDAAWFLAPAYLGKKLRVQWAPGASEEKRGRVYTTTETSVIDEDGREILRRRGWDTSIARDRPVAAKQESQQSASIERQSVRKLNGFSDCDIEFYGHPKHMSLEHMRLFSGWPTKNIHTDEAVAVAAGLKAPIAAGAQSMGHVCELLIDIFGDGWLDNGSWTLSFLKPVYPGEVLTSRATVKTVVQEGVRLRYELSVSTIDQYGIVTSVGTAGAYRGQ